MSTWHHYPLSHPWMSMRKRKLTESADDADHDNTTAQSHASRILPHPKRRRFDLARNLSRLSLFEQAQAQAPIIEEQQGNHLPSKDIYEEVNTSPWFSDPQGALGDTAMDTDGEIQVVQPIVEEPTEHAILDIRMRHTSSYEPEKDRIVITDLDSSEDEAETLPETSGDDQYSVSYALLSRINTKTSTSLIKDIPSTPQSDPSQALVLFRPSPWSAKDPRELEEIYRARDEENHHVDQTAPHAKGPDTDAMDIE